MTEQKVERRRAELFQMYHNSPNQNYHDFTPNQMDDMTYQVLEEGCPVHLRTLSDEEIAKTPIMKQVLFLMKTLAEKEIKLTAKGNLPGKIVEQVYQLGSRSRYTDTYDKLTEDRCQEVQVVRAALEQTSLIKKRKGKMSLTIKGKKMLKNPNELLRTIMIFLLWEFNTGYLDGWPDLKSGNIGRMYSLWLLHHYGKEWHHFSIYKRDYFRAFPFIQENAAYAYRTFIILFRIIGLCEIDEYPKQAGPYLNEEVRKTPILDMMFSFEEPAKKQEQEER